MKTTVSRRGLVRLISFFIFAVAILAAADLMYMQKIKRLENAVQAGYSSAVEGLAQSADTISTVLTKGRYASSPSMMSRLSGELMASSMQAKTALESLPVAGMSIDNLEKFLSQVGNYATSLSRRATAGESLSDEDRANVASLSECADRLSEELWSLRMKMVTSDQSVEEIFEGVDSDVGSFLADGVSGIEDGLKEMPKLIYDGPFSDHILERVPLMTKDANPVSEDEAREKAAKALGVDSYRVLTSEAGEEGKMPAYCFYSEGGRCAVSKNGGYIIYCIKQRNVRDSALSAEEATEYAEEYLKNLGIENMEKTYFECFNGVCTINYAYRDGDVICYTDLIKVAVALDNGEILGYDARGFLVNHHERKFDEPKITEDEAVGNISKSLEPQGCGLAVIPTDSVKEKLCYEVKCRTENGRDVLIYVNAETGDEEEILLLLITEAGQLTV